jgi:hypothetical protein
MTLSKLIDLEFIIMLEQIKAFEIIGPIWRSIKATRAPRHGASPAILKSRPLPAPAARACQYKRGEFRQ